MLDGIWEILQSTDWDALLWWILSGAIGLGHKWYDHLDSSNKKIMGKMVLATQRQIIANIFIELN